MIVTETVAVRAPPAGKFKVPLPAIKSPGATAPLVPVPLAVAQFREKAAALPALVTVKSSVLVPVLPSTIATSFMLIRSAASTLLVTSCPLAMKTASGVSGSKGNVRKLGFMERGMDG